MNVARILPFVSLFGLSAALPFSNLAECNLALGKPVSLTGYFGVGSGYFGANNPPYVGVPDLPPAKIVTDGIIQGNWTQGVWWDEQYNDQHGLGTHNYVTVDLQGTFQVQKFDLAVDENDRYLLEVRDAGGNWTVAWDVPILGHERSLTLATPIEATAVRLSGYTLPNVPGTDYAYSVSEIKVSCVPEPSSYAFVFGLVLLGGGVVRRYGVRTSRRPLN
ncbi:MAG: hypothetical protein U1G08_14210 [Verrucomicrobiota bacterium]